MQRIHAYAASFGEDLARELILDHTSVGDMVLDPFVGAGTGVLEGVLSGRNAIGIDIDPIACRISRVLTSSLDVPYFTKATRHLQDKLKMYEQRLLDRPAILPNLAPGESFDLGPTTLVIPNEPALTHWFAPSHMATLSVICKMVDEEPDMHVREVFEVAISSSIIRKWPNTLSYAMDIDHSRPHRPRDVAPQPIEKQFALFDRVLLRVTETVCNLQGLLHSSGAHAIVLEGDSERKLSLLKRESANFILTSPPYLNAIDYPRAHKFAQWWLPSLGGAMKRADYIGLRTSKAEDRAKESLLALPSVTKLFVPFEGMPIYRNILQYVRDIAGVVIELHRVLMCNSTIVFVVADNVISGTVFPVSQIIKELFVQYGFSAVTVAERPIKSTRRRYPFGSTGFDGPMQKEFLVTGVKAPG